MNASDKTEKEYYKQERVFFTNLKNAGFCPQSVFDVGSSHAYWSVTVERVFTGAEMHLFEPLVDIKPFYKEHCYRVLAEKPNFHLHKVLLGDRNGPVTFYADSAGYGASTLVSKATKNFEERVDAPMYRMDDFCRENSIRAPEVLKLDVQGGELNVLVGATNSFGTVKIIQAETWFRRGYGVKTPLFHEIIDFLWNRGFLLFEIGESFYSEIHELYSCDSFFAKKDFLNLLKGKLPQDSLLTRVY